MRSLGRVGTSGAVQPLVKTIEDSQAIVRRAALHALGEIGPDAALAVPALQRAAETGDVATRLEAIDALGKIGPAARIAVSALRKALEDPNLKRNAARSLARLGVTE